MLVSCRLTQPRTGRRVQKIASGAASAPVEACEPLLTTSYAAASAAAHSTSRLSESLEAVRLERGAMTAEARRVEAIQVQQLHKSQMVDSTRTSCSTTAGSMAWHRSHCG